VYGGPSRHGSTPMLLRFAAPILACVCCVPAPASAQTRPLRIGNVMAQFEGEAPTFEPFTNYLSSHVTERSFEVVPLESIDQMVSMADTGRLDFVIASPVALVALNARHRVRPIATVTQPVGSILSPWLAAAVFTPPIEKIWSAWKTRAVTASWHSRHLRSAAGWLRSGSGGIWVSTSDATFPV
jgi:ABC-type phosphate/phosphonate transport system substrate-binding protein